MIAGTGAITRGIAMKVFGALLVVILFVGCPLFGQADNPNAGVEAWREAMAEYNLQAEELRQQYAADRDLWQAQFEEATRPLSAGKKLLMGLAYAGDKALTGVVNYYSNRAAIRSEMGRFDQRFGALRNDVLDSRTRILGGIDGSRTDILAGIDGSRTDILAGIDGSRTDILAGIDGSRTDILAGIDGSETRIFTGITGAEGRVLTGIAGGGATLTENLGHLHLEVDRNQELLQELRNLTLPLCSSPFGSTSQMPCRD